MPSVQKKIRDINRALRRKALQDADNSIPLVEVQEKLNELKLQVDFK